MSNPYDNNYFGNNYYPNNSFAEMPQYRPPLARPPLIPDARPNYRPRGQSYGGGGPVSNDKFNNFNRRQRHPYFGQKSQYRAQVIDYSNGVPHNELSMPSMTSNTFPGVGQQPRYS